MHANNDDAEAPLTETVTDSPPPRTRPPIETLLGRALRLKCPRCGKGRLFSGAVRMPQQCESCGLVFHRAPGYFLGSTYINYGSTAVIVASSFLIARIFFQIPGKQMLWFLVPFCVVFPLLIFRHARAIWLAFDCQFDSSVLEDEWISNEETGSHG